MITLVLGGARSGKSELAERLATKHAINSQIVYVATSIPDPDDTDFAARIEAHRRRRPCTWITVEAGADLVGALRETDPDATVLVDSLGTWLAAQPHLHADVAEIVKALRGRRGATVIVSDEVGLGVHPSSELGRDFRDRLGDVNREIAAEADEVLLVIAGRALALDPVDPTDR